MPDSSGSEQTPSFINQMSLALELPAVLVGSVIVGGGIGYLIDRWTHTEFLFKLIFGGLGFAAGIADVIRRTKGNQKPNQPSGGSGDGG
ncbi:MAG TPA: AtpZ/AtpI family protein [Candidatus Acidoferrum sp.]|nr:AtpZ/AtpI family protein [Candidatus Acidoferrum sp.]